MPMSIEADTTGLDRVAAVFSSGKASAAVTRAQAGALLPVAKDESPVDTGALRDSHRVAEQGGEAAVVAGWTRGVDYARPVHARDPWLRRASMKAARRIARAGAEALKKEIGG